MHTLRRLPLWVAFVLLIYMPFHIFLAQSLSLATGGLEVWKVGKDIVLAVAALFTVCLVWQQKAGDRYFRLFLGLAAAYFVMHMLTWVLNPDIYERSALLGIIYNMRLPAFLLLGYGAVLLYPTKFVFSSILKVVAVLGTVVAALGIVQYFLPSDILTHAGYGLERGTRAAFFIEDNPELPRIMSTLREPNALGAYLIVPATALFAGLLTRVLAPRVRFMYASALVLQLLAVWLTFSRSAWLGLALAFGLVAWWRYKSKLTASLRRYWPIAAGILLLVCTAAFMARDTVLFQQYIVHRDPQEQVADLDSNDLHLALARQGLMGIADQPLGHGPGTAGIVSIQNPAGGQLTENYYLQIGYELGVFGLLVFMTFIIWLYVVLSARAGRPRALLAASFWAYALINMLLHSWSNEAVAAQWWLLSGLALGAAALPPAAAKQPS